jgi:hypothetical protein
MELVEELLEHCRDGDEQDCRGDAAEDIPHVGNPARQEDEIAWTRHVNFLTAAETLAPSRT